MKLIAENVTINAGLFAIITGVFLTACLGVLGYVMKRLVDLGEIAARTTEQLDDLERRTTVTEADVRVLYKWNRVSRPPRGSAGNQPRSGV